ncbi:hypothetical protein, partial [Nocardia brasiliensis]|uniref:hypothetical protein n=1 Tax=Nocardia brasiliensis TaxID=37326 RepID=UPI0024589E95
MIHAPPHGVAHSPSGRPVDSSCECSDDGLPLGRGRVVVGSGSSVVVVGRGLVVVAGLVGRVVGVSDGSSAELVL